MVNEFLIYLAQSSIALILLFCVYKISVSGLTFHSGNRTVLLVLPVLSLILPVLEFDFSATYAEVSSRVPFINGVLSYSQLEELNKKVTSQVVALEEETLGYLMIPKVILIIYSIGSAISLIRFLVSSLQILELKKNSKLSKIKGHKVFLTKGSSVFSFFNWIFIPEEKKASLDIRILEHEATHIKYRHTFDLFYLQLYAILFWFNPMLAAYRKSLRSVHEFQADAIVLENGTKPSEYLSLILADIERKRGMRSLSYFNNLIIKKRIEMIEKTKSKKHALARYSFLGIAVLTITLGFKEPNFDTTKISAVQNLKETIPTALPSIFPVKGHNRSSITSGFGQKVKHPETGQIVIHGGIDIKAPKGTPVLAAASGVVVQANLENDWGNLIIIAHDDGYQTWYGHLDRFEVSGNTTVEKGDIIGYVGSTGLSSGDHLHYEVRKEGKHLNPKDFF